MDALLAAYLFIVPLLELYSNNENTFDQECAVTLLISLRPHQCHLLQIASKYYLALFGCDNNNKRVVVVLR